MGNLTKKLKSGSLGLGILSLTLLPMKFFGQEYQKKISSYGGFSIAQFNDKTTREETGSLPGIILGHNQKISNEFFAKLSAGYYFNNNPNNNYQTSMFEFGPKIEGHTDWGLYFGAGVKYRGLCLTERKTKIKENFSGAGLTINFGLEKQIGKKRKYFYLESEYDQIKAGNRKNLGITKINAGFKF